GGIVRWEQRCVQAWESRPEQGRSEHDPGQELAGDSRQSEALGHATEHHGDDEHQPELGHKENKSHVLTISSAHETCLTRGPSPSSPPHTLFALRCLVKVPQGGARVKCRAAPGAAHACERGDMIPAPTTRSRSWWPPHDMLPY